MTSPKEQMDVIVAGMIERGERTDIVYPMTAILDPTHPDNYWRDREVQSARSRYEEIIHQKNQTA